MENETDSFRDKDESDQCQFARVIEVACAAKHVIEQAAEAVKKANVISELAVEATQTAHDLRMLAQSMVATTASLSAVVLNASKFKDLQEAFDSNKLFSEQIDYSSFKDIVTKKIHFAPTSNTEYDDSYLLEPKYLPSIKTIDDGIAQSYQAQKYRNIIQEDEQQIPTHKQYTRVEPLRQLSTNSSKSTPYLKDRPKSQYVDTDDVYNGKYAKERFPPAKSPMEYKDSLAASFDSKVANAPLWEDRYINDTSRETASPTGVPERWTDKKAIKQLQIKLHCEKEDCGESDPTHPNTFTSLRSNNGSESDSSGDREVDRILQEPRPLRKLKRLEGKSSGLVGNLVQGEENEALMSARMNQTRDRSLSPLLNNKEKGKVMSDDGNGSKRSGHTKHYFNTSGSVSSQEHDK